MAVPKSSIKDFEKFENSPYPILSVGTRRIVSRGQRNKWENENTGEVTVLVTDSKERIVPHDELRFVKLFHSGLEYLHKLNVRGLTLFWYMASQLKPGTSVVYIDREDAIDKCPRLKGTSFYVALLELLDNGIIARKSGHKHEYWVNPNIIFTGDRTKLVKNQQITRDKK